MAERGDLEAAIAFRTSTDPGTSNYHFYAYDKALVAVNDINQRALNGSIVDDGAAVRGWTALFPYGAGVLVVLLVGVGVWPRLAEYC